MGQPQTQQQPQRQQQQQQQPQQPQRPPPSKFNTTTTQTFMNVISICWSERKHGKKKMKNPFVQPYPSDCFWRQARETTQEYTKQNGTILLLCDALQFCLY